MESCGPECCCNKYLQLLKPVSMQMAKMQKATLDPSKISGCCGRLKCCLRYEDENYTHLKQNLPRKGVLVQTKQGEGKVFDTQILTQLVVVEYANGERAAFPLDEGSRCCLPRRRAETASGRAAGRPWALSGRAVGRPWALSGRPPADRRPSQDEPPADREPSQDEPPADRRPSRDKRPADRRPSRDERPGGRRPSRDERPGGRRPPRESPPVGREPSEEESPFDDNPPHEADEQEEQ